MKHAYFKKTLAFIAAIIFTLVYSRADATMIMVDYLGDTLVTSNNIERTLVVNSDDGGYYNIAIKPLQESITSSDGEVEIPLEYLFINNTKEDVYLKYNEYSNIFYGASMDGIPRNMTAKIKNYGIVPAGIYSINFEILATDIETGEQVAVSNFNLQFIVSTIHELNTYSETPNITIGASDVFKKSERIANETSPMIYIRSNTDWILSLDTSDFGTAMGKYYVRTTSASGMVTSRLEEFALITPDREIILARGKSPAVNEFVAVEFSIENPDEGTIPAGSYVNRVKYILREGEG